MFEWLYLMTNKNNVTKFSSKFTIVIVTILISTIFLMPFKESHGLEDNLKIKGLWILAKYRM